MMNEAKSISYDRCCAEFPCYELRYGQRGKRFSAQWINAVNGII